MGFRHFLTNCWALRKNLRYNTVKIVSIQNTKLAVLHYTLQVLIVAYVAVYAVYLNKGYQAFGEVGGSTMLKVKGSSYNNGSRPWNDTAGSLIPEPYTPYLQVYDSTDLVYPAMERDAIFVSTNLWLTNNQTRDVCYPGNDLWWTKQFPESEGEPAAIQGCNDTCVRGTVVNEADLASGGIWTGESQVKLIEGMYNCYCELYTWCPDENEPERELGPGDFYLVGVENFTVSVRQNVQFQKFGILTDNMPKNSYVPPIWTLTAMAAEAGLEFEKLRQYGATIVMSCEWECNLDYHVDHCHPKVKFIPLSTSFNFRRVEYDDGLISSRQLIKHAGIRVIIVLAGQGGKFDLATLFANIGAGIGLLTVAGLVADFAAVNLLGHKEIYKQAKFRNVEVQPDGRARGLSNVWDTAIDSQEARLMQQGIYVPPEEREEPWARRQG